MALALELKWTLQEVAISLDPILATKQFVVPLLSFPIMLGRLIQLFRHLKHQNLSIISDSIGRANMVKQFCNGTDQNRVDWYGGMVEYS